MIKDFITLSRAAFGDNDDGSDYDHDGDDGAESVKRCLSDDSGVHDTYKQMVIGDDDHNGEDCGWNRRRCTSDGSS